MKLYTDSSGRLALHQHPGFRPYHNHNWRLREAHRTLPPLPYLWEQLPLDADHRLRPHTVAGKLAYYRSDKDRELDQLRLINADQYLSEFHPTVDAALLVKALMPTPFKISQTAEEAVTVYTQVQHASCMSPGRQYGPASASAYAGDIRVAYFEDYSARCVVYPAKQLFGYVYGPNKAELRQSLTQAGYKEGTEFNRRHEWWGAQLTGKPAWWDIIDQYVNDDYEIVGA
jgi:hypothetical protein